MVFPLVALLPEKLVLFEPETLLIPLDDDCVK